MTDKQHIVVISPFVDKRHGTERCVAEQVERLASNWGHEIYLYSQRVEDIPGIRVDGTDAKVGDAHRQIVWRRIPNVPGPHLLKYCWWFAANHLWRWWDRSLRGQRHDVVLSPGINCLDADIIAIHITFAEFYARVKGELLFRSHPVRLWPLLLHRRLYYQMIIALERLVYPRREVLLTAVSQKVAHEVVAFYSRSEPLPVIYHGLDSDRFTPDVRKSLRSEARASLGLSSDAFAVLLIGNDWKNKGLPALLQAVAPMDAPRLYVLVVGQDDVTPYQPILEQNGLHERVRFLPGRRDVEFYYAAADIYVGPSLEDAFALPPAEAMACGLPVIVSSHAGVSEIVTDGVDGFILKDPRDARELAGLIRPLYDDLELRSRLGEHAAETARQYTWDRNAAELHALIQVVLKRKSKL